MKTVTVKVNKPAEDIVVEILNFLEGVSSSRSRRRIRIGGKEFDFYGDLCVLKDVVVVDDNPSAQQGYLQNPVVATIPTATVTAPTSFVSVSTNDMNKTSQSDELDEGIDIILTDLCENGGLFTAFDITKELRNNGTSCRHSQVRKIVHEAFNNGDMGDGYQRSLIFVKDSVQAFVFHPNSVDPLVYVDGDDDAMACNKKKNTDDLDELDDLD